MRKLIAVEWISLDGVMEAPEEWAFSYSDEALEEANAAGMARSDALLLGRVTYEQFASYWPHQPAGTPVADYTNSVRKHVVSGTLEEPLAWNNSALIQGDVSEEIVELKQRPGKNITVVGSATLVRALLEHGLLDELILLVHPVVLGSGKRLFEGGEDRTALELAGSETFGTGVVSLTYRPVKRRTTRKG